LECNSSVTKIVAKDWQGKVEVISPPFDLSQIELVASGDYQVDADGKVRSAHLNERRKSNAKCEGEELKRYVCPLIAGDIDDIQMGEPAAFINERWHKGLKNCVRIEKRGAPPIYIIDNHTIAYFVFEEALKRGDIEEDALLIHIDDHQDHKEGGVCKCKDLREAADFVTNELHEGNFICPAIEKGIIGQYWYFHTTPYDDPSFDVLGYWEAKVCRGRTTLQQLLMQEKNPKRVIVDVDLDAFVLDPYLFLSYPANDAYPEEAFFSITAWYIAQIAQSGGVVILTTGPGWADQDTAIRLARQTAEEITNRPKEE
jgi:hypothetical protein